MASGVAESRRADEPGGDGPNADVMPPTGRQTVSFAALVGLGASLALGPLVRAARMPDTRVWSVLVACALVGGAAALGCRIRREIGRILVAVTGAVVAGAVVRWGCGEVLAAWAVLVGAAWSIAVVTRQTLSRPAAVTAAVVGVLAAVVGWNSNAGFRPLPLAAAVLGIVVGDRLFPGALRRAERRIGHVVGVGVSAILFALLAVVALLIPWLVSLGGRLFRRRPGNWDAIDDTDTARSWASRGTTRRVWPAVVAAVLLVAGFVVYRRVERSHQATNGGLALTTALNRSNGRGGAWWNEPTAIPASHKDDAWYPEYRRAIEWVMNQAVAFRPLHQYRVKDVKTAYVNVVGGYRRTWTPPKCACPEVTLWLFGGSTTFGIGQRDEFTIASQLAKEAWQHGVALRVVNKGEPADMHWQESQRLAWDLTREKAPDIVVFYDGVNEIWGTGTRRDSADHDPAQPIEPLVDQFFQGVLDVYDSDPPPTPKGAEVVSPGAAKPSTPEEVGRTSVARYERSRQISADIATARHLPMMWAWQPSRLSRPAVAGEPNDGDGEDDARRITAAAEADLPAGVVDLSRTFDGVDKPLFSDDVHHNELGAQLMAAALWRELVERYPAVIRADGG